MSMVAETTIHDVVITADAHVGEPEAFRSRLPKKYRNMLPELTVDEHGNLEFRINGKNLDEPSQARPTARDLVREFRSDPSQGTDLTRRFQDMGIESVDAQVIFPNIGLTCSMGNQPADFYHTWARTYNDWVFELFESNKERLKPAAMLAVDDLDDLLAEANRSIERGACTLFLPSVVPWRPYALSDYEPLWSLAEEASVPLNFHVFSGNVGLDAALNDITRLDESRYQQAKSMGKHPELDDERLNATVLGMAAGMNTVVELTGSGVLERHPGLRFVITESDFGWLAWTLQAMDQMQERRYLNMRKLPLRASEYFKRQGAITFGDDPVGLSTLDFIGADRVIWGNDYPHDEGTFPDSCLAIERVRNELSPCDAHKVLAANAAEWYGFDLNYLAANRAEIDAYAIASEDP